VKPPQLAGASAWVEDEEEAEPDVELQAALARARRLRQHAAPLLPKVRPHPHPATARALFLIPDMATTRATKELTRPRSTRIRQR
jgi:hypothetical protein